MKPQEKHYYTPEEYLSMEENAEYRSEYYDGEIFAMAGASLNHNTIAGNIFSVLNTRFRKKPCRAFINDMRLLISSHELYTYPDIMVICGTMEFIEGRDDTVTNPQLIIEVLSESTKNYDRGEKFEFYRSLSSLKEYILIDQYKIHVEQFWKNEDGLWVLREYNERGETLNFTSVEIPIDVDIIYNKVEFKEIPRE